MTDEEVDAWADQEPTPYQQGFARGYGGPPFPWEFRWMIARRLIGIMLILIGVTVMMASVANRDMYLLFYGIAMMYFGDKL